jgi:hypothetical protein
LTGSVPIESIAQAIHERWRREAIANDDTAPTWQQPGESRKESSRRRDAGPLILRADQRAAIPARPSCSPRPAAPL